MITIEAPYYLVKGVTVFRDHADPDLFYYLPGQPALAPGQDHSPFVLYKWRDDLTLDPVNEPTRVKGAGMALFDIEIVGPSVTVLQTEVSSQSGRPDARLVPVMFRTGVCRSIIAQTQDSKLMTDLIEEHPAPLTSPYHVAFALQLDQEGTTLMQQAAQGGSTATLPVGVVYEMTFLALSPSIHAHVTMDFDNCYNHFAASIGFSYYVKVGLDLDISWLIEHDFIKIDITQFTDDQDAATQRKLVTDLVTARVQSGFFKTVLAPIGDGSVPQSPIGGLPITSASAMFTLRLKAEILNETKSFDFVYDGRTAITLTHTMSGFLSALAKDATPPPEFHEIDLHDPFFDTLDVAITSTASFDQWADLAEVDVNFGYQDVRKGYTFNKDNGGPYRFQAALKSATDDQYQYDVQYHFTGDPALIAVAQQTTRTRVLVVNPIADIYYRAVHFTLGPVDPARVASIKVHLRVPSTEPGQPDLQKSDFTLDATHPDYWFRFHRPAGSPPIKVLIKSDWQEAGGAWHTGDDSITVTGDSYEVLGPFVDVLGILIQPAADWSKVNAVQAEVHYADGPYNQSKTFLFTNTQKTAQELDIPIMDATKRTYQWRQVVTYNDKPATQTDLADSKNSILVVGLEPKTTGDVQVTWLGSPGDALALRVDFWGADYTAGDPAVTSALMRAGSDFQKTVTLPLGSDGKLAYHYEVHQYTANGDQLVRSGDGSTNILVVQSASTN